MNRKKLLAPVALLLCVVITIFFAASVASSRHEIPTSLVDMFGDTSGIRNLSIDGLIRDHVNNYAYTFSVNPQRATTDMRVHRSREDVERDMINNYRFNYGSNIAFIPVGETTRVLVDSDSGYYSDGKTTVPLTEDRVYAERFEVVPILDMLNTPILLDPDRGKLYHDGGDEGYIFAFKYPENERVYRLEEYQPGFSVEQSKRLDATLAVGDKRLLVLVGSGFYGHTALYMLETEELEIHAEQNGDYYQEYVAAEELYPIELSREDEILGLIQLGDGALLAIQRTDGLTLLRIDAQCRVSATVHAEGAQWMGDYRLTDDSLVMVGSSITYDRPDVHAFDLSGGGLAHVMSVGSANLWDVEQGRYVHNIMDAVWKDGILYAAVVTMHDYNAYLSNRVTITALGSDGQIVGRCMLRCGIEQDDLQIITADGNTKRSNYVRQLESITLR